MLGQAAASRLAAVADCTVSFSLTETKLVKNKKIMNSLSKTKTKTKNDENWNETKTRKQTRGSAIAEEQRDALRQLKYYGRFLTELLTRSSANTEEPCEHTASWNRVKCCTYVRRIACENVCNRRMTFKVIQGHCRSHHLIGHILFHISLPL